VSNDCPSSFTFDYWRDRSRFAKRRTWARKNSLELLVHFESFRVTQPYFTDTRFPVFLKLESQLVSSFHSVSKTGDGKRQSGRCVLMQSAIRVLATGSALGVRLIVGCIDRMPASSKESSPLSKPHFVCRVSSQRKMGGFVATLRKCGIAVRCAAIYRKRVLWILMLFAALVC